MGVSAGLVSYGRLGGVPVLQLTPNSTAYTTPLAGYGTIGVSDSGAFGLEAQGFKKWFFNIIGPGATTAGYSVTIYATIDPALKAYMEGNNTVVAPALYGTGKEKNYLPGSSWFQLPGPSEQGGTGTSSNPLVTGATGTLLQAEGAFIAFRAVLTTLGSPTQPATVLAYAVP